MGNAQRVLVEANALQQRGFNQEMESLVNKFTTGATSQKHMSKHSELYMNRKKSREPPNNRSNSKDRRLRDIDRINQEVERKLKAQRKQEKERIKKYGQIYGPNLFSNQKAQANASSQSAQPRSQSKERRAKSSSQQTRLMKANKNPSTFSKGSIQLSK